MVGSLPGATITMSKISKIQTVSIFPEGWAFFTKDPQEEDYLLFQVDEQTGNFVNVISPTSSPENAFGLNRVSRLQSQELGSGIHHIRDSSWADIKGDLTANILLIREMKPVAIPIRSQRPYFEGTYILQKIRPIPWAWAKSFNEKNRKSKICKIEFKKLPHKAG